MRTKSEQGKFAKRKGSNYERDIARKLSRLTGQTWRRTPYSGAGHIAGDVFRLGPSPCPYTIELKNRADINLDRIFRNPNSVWEFVSNTQILVFNNHGQDLGIIPEYDLQGEPIHLNLEAPCIYSEIWFSGETYLLIPLPELARYLKNV